MSHYTRIRFDAVTSRRVVRIACANCGIIRERTLSAFQTISPFNVNADGSVKSREDIKRELPAELDKREAALRGSPLICTPCERAIAKASDES